MGRICRGLGQERVLRVLCWVLGVAVLALGGVIIRLGPGADRAAATVPPAGRPPDAAAAWQTASRLRQSGRFAEAETLLRSALATASEPQRRLLDRELLGTLHDGGRLDALLIEVRAYRARYPHDPAGLLEEARALLFRAAAENWHAGPAVDEAAAAVAALERSGWAPPESPGASWILRAQLDYLRGRYPGADADAARGLQLGADPGERADLLLMRADLALRRGDPAAARRLLSEQMAAVASWGRQAVYYQLYPLRACSLFVRLAYCGDAVPPDAVRAIDERDTALRGAGTLGRFDRPGATRLLARLGRLEPSRELALLERFFAAFPPRHAPTCFYGEQVYLPLVAAAAQLRMGDLCRRLGRSAAARDHYKRAMAAHGDDQIVARRLAMVARMVNLP